MKNQNLNLKTHRANDPEFYRMMRIMLVWILASALIAFVVVWLEMR